MKLPKHIPIFGDIAWRGDCAHESVEQITFFNMIRADHPTAIHIRNEGKRSHQQAARHKADGMVKGASDIIIPGRVTFVCELKRKDHTKSTISKEQITYLEKCRDDGAFACIALGYEGALEALEEWTKI